MRSIVHLDADAFFASVEQAADSRLRGKPIAVGGTKRGIIASASYEARKFGVFTPMPTVRARKLCPKLIILPGDFEKYEQFSRWMFSYAYDFTPDVEISSIDEGYFDLSGARKSPLDIAEAIRRAIRQSLKISVSEGIAANKLVSQIASKLNKPAAFAHVALGEEIPFLHPLPNRWLPGIGPKTGARLDAAGLAQIGQIAVTPLDLLHLVLGNTARQVKDFANARDNRPVVPERDPAKSYSQQETFVADTTDEEYVEAVLHRQADELMMKVRQDAKSIRTLTVKVRYNDMAEDQCSESLVEPTDLETDLYPRLHAMLRRAWRRRVSLRLVSLKFSNIYNATFGAELPLERATQQHAGRRRLAEMVDALRKTHGRRIILRGHDFLLDERAGKALLLQEKPIPPPPESRPQREDTAGVRYSPTAPPPDHTRIQTAVKLAMESLRHPPAQMHATALTASRFQVHAKSRLCQSIPLAVHSNYSFLDSTLSIEAIVELAKRDELPAIALTDSANLHGAVQFAQAAKDAGIKPIIGAEIFVEGKPLRLYVQNARGYTNLCHILTQRRANPDQPADSEMPGLFGTIPETLRAHAEGLLAVSPEHRLAPIFPGRFYLEVHSLDELRKLPNTGLPLVTSVPVRYATDADRPKYDLVQSIRTLTLLKQTHPRKHLDGDYHFRSQREMNELFSRRPELLAHSREIAERCAFEFSLGRPQFPPFAPPDGSTPKEFLRRIVMRGAQQRYPGKLHSIKSQLEEELAIIGQVGYEEYFLVVWDLLQDCRREGIQWLTRGSAADSLVCYCLGISDVCPIRFDLYFRRFLNKDRMQLNKLPDIDIDFPHDRKDDVIDLLLKKYGHEHAAVVGGFSTYQARGAVADIAKVLGVSEFQIRRFTEHFPWSSARCIGEALRQTQECRDLPLDEEPYSTALQMAEFLDGFPRYPKMHPCGVVLSRQPMLQLTPTFMSQKGYPTTHFDMDSVEAIGLIKIDILAQGGLAVMRDVAHMLEDRGIEIAPVNLALAEDIRSVRPATAPAPPENTEHFNCPQPAAFCEPWDDRQVWQMIASGGARAVHHIESPAMVSLCRMCNVSEIDGLVAIVSVIRPGAANEQKKARFVRRYQGLEPVTYPHPSLEPCLKSTFGLVVYEEHILQICEAFAGLAPGRADVLRRALGKQKQKVIDGIHNEFIASSLARGHAPEKIAEVWELISGFAGYAFCKAHSTAYGVEAYQSAWLKRYYPAEFMAGVLTNGKGFYHPLVYVLECHRLGIPLLPPWVNQPGPSFTVVSAPAVAGPTYSNNSAIRVPVTRTKGLTQRTKEKIEREFSRGTFDSMRDFHRRLSPLPEEMEALIRVGAFDGFGQSRTTQFWESQFLQRAFHGDPSGQGWLFPAPKTECPPQVREPTRMERLQSEMELLDFPANGHPLELYNDIAWETYCPVNRLGNFANQEIVTCGLVIEQRTYHQVTGEPMKFLTLADRTGIVETELFAATYRSYGLATVRYPVLEVTARVEPYENGHGHSLRVLKAGKPRLRTPGGNPGALH